MVLVGLQMVAARVMRGTANQVVSVIVRMVTIDNKRMYFSIGSPSVSITTAKAYRFVRFMSYTILISRCRILISAITCKKQDEIVLFYSIFYRIKQDYWYTSLELQGA